MSEDPATVARAPLLRIHLFGHLRLFYQERPFILAAPPKAQPLWAYLLLHRDGPVPRDVLAYTLWSDVLESEARANLRRHLHELRRALPPEPAETPWFLTEASTLQWNPQAPYWLDVAEFERLSRQPDRLAEAVALYTGDLLANLYDDWLYSHRERLQNLFFSDLSQLIGRSRQNGDYPQAIAYAQQILNADPLREDVIRELMSLRYVAGDRAGALQEHLRFKQRLEEELGVVPMPETVRLHELIAANKPLPGHVEQTATIVRPPVTAEPAAPPHNIPAPLTAFVGRSQEIAEVMACLSGPDAPARLLTLTGPGGTGKTRLALEVARRFAAQRPPLFADGVFLVRLAEISDTHLVPFAIAEVLGLKESAPPSRINSVKSHLRSQQLLLLLDNFEQVVDAAPVLTELLSAAPGLRLLVTSRTVLHVYGEHEYPVPPLPLPDLDHLPPLAELFNYAAITLFVERARAVRPDFALNESNAPAVAEICVRLDGLPLALELAAARSKLFAPTVLLGQLANRLSFLASQARTLPARQQTLRAAIDWSYNLLAEPEKILFACLAVFNGAFSLDAAEQVAGRRLAETGHSLAMIDALASLADKSMLRQVRLAEDEDQPRFRMLLTIREYALERLIEKGEQLALQQLHANYYLALAEEASSKLLGTERADWLRRLKREEDNIRAALAWALDAAAPPERAISGTRLALALYAYWTPRGNIAEGREWLQRALERRLLLPAASQVTLLNQTGWFAQLQGDYEAAEPLHQEALALAQELNDRPALANTLHFLGNAAGRQGRYEQADELLSRSLALYRQMTEIPPGQYASLLNNLAIVAKRRGDYARATALLEESLALHRDRGEASGVAAVLANLGGIAALQKEYGRAVALHRESLALRQSVNDQMGIMLSLGFMAELAAIQGYSRRAALLYAASETLRQSIGASRTPATQDEYEQNLATARRHLSEADFAAAWEEGKAMSVPQAVTYALEEE
ncbi:MAG: tetratricopeptide repeat protein [Chloroflexi bacterium]|nr:tetratricopeptide repeat protein [Chloroflexota bacterium]MCI0577180.1 tetratricopeptide repeat protein [Chloroflexota bacterium]MCI0649252.1 tetratricopeptide repeat protein [Chloroflexota bacterium]MCI0730434.1 tetratricopeptide repeat protein [Chloroflexota bacterium]